MKQDKLQNSDLFFDKEKGLFEERIRNTFFPGKFSAPRIDAAFHIFRGNAVRALLSPARRNPRITCLEARAGQGKSTLAAQFLHYIQAQYAWCQIGPEDNDPVVFVSALFTALLKAFPALSQSCLYTTISKGVLMAEEAHALAALMAEDLKSLMHDEFYLVLDDLHFLDGADDCLSFLNAFIAQAPEGLRIILISRTKIDVRSENVLRLDNESLTVTPEDAAELLTTLFQARLPAETMGELHRVSEGWIMGVILTGNVLLEKLQDGATPAVADLVSGQSGQFWAYFQEEILNTLDVAARRALLGLALLDNIPVGLAAAVLPAQDSAALLKSLAEKNYFLRQLEESPACYCFHQLFREFLRRHAEKELSRRQRRIIMARAGLWFRRQHHYEKALRYYLKAEAYGMVERILHDIGPYLLATNRTATLKDLIAQLSPEKVQPYARLSYFIANVYIRSASAQCLPYLEQARRRFIAADDAVGELMATTTLISFHAGVDCRFKQGMMFLPRAEALYEKLTEQLSVAARIHSGYDIIFGLCYFTGQISKAARYVDQCMKLAEAHHLDDALAATAMARGLILCLEGRWSDFRHHFEEVYGLLQSPRVGPMAKLPILLQELVMMCKEAEVDTYQQCRTQLIRFVDRVLFAETLSGAWLPVCDIEIAVARGRLTEALDAARQGLASCGSSQSALMQSCLQDCQAYIYALQGRRAEALTAVEQAARLREQAGGAYHDMLHWVMAGGTYAYLDMHEAAESLLSRAVSGAKRLGAGQVLTSAHAHRAYLRLKSGRIRLALEDLACCLRAMKSAPYHRFFMFNPTLAVEILTAAVQHGIERDHALTIAREQLNLTIKPAGDLVPLLEIKSLGGLELSIDAEVKIRQGDLTAAQEELLALLISTPQAGLPCEIIQDAFWPGNPPSKGRSKLNTLLNRLKNELSKRLASYSAGDYLVMEKGWVCLQNCNIDAHRFRKDVRKGAQHMQKCEARQAEHAFFRAHRQYQGAFMPGIHLRGAAARYEEALQEDYRQSVCRWAPLLADAGLKIDGIEVMRKAFQSYPTHQKIAKTYYCLLTQNNEPMEAGQVLVDYKKALAGSGASPAEVERMLEKFWRSSIDLNNKKPESGNLCRQGFASQKRI